MVGSEPVEGAEEQYVKIQDGRFMKIARTGPKIGSAADGTCGGMLHVSLLVTFFACVHPALGKGSRQQADASTCMPDCFEALLPVS